jgi:hypothetical protein
MNSTRLFLILLNIFLIKLKKFGLFIFDFFSKNIFIFSQKS